MSDLISRQNAIEAFADMREGYPVVHPEAFQIDKHCSGTDGLEGRMARCTYNCGSKTQSKWELPFFKYQPDNEYDSYYCGCFGWDQKMEKYYVSYMCIYSDTVVANSFEEAAEIVANNCEYDVDGYATVTCLDTGEEREV